MLQSVGGNAAVEFWQKVLEEAGGEDDLKEDDEEDDDEVILVLFAVVVWCVSSLSNERLFTYVAISFGYFPLLNCSWCYTLSSPINIVGLFQLNIMM